MSQTQNTLKIHLSQYCFANISATKAPIFIKIETFIHEIVKNYPMIFRKDPCIHTHTRRVNLFFYVFSAFSKFEHQNSKNIENYKLVIWSFGNLISKCSGIAKILPPILVRTVVFNRNYKEKLFIQLLMITLYLIARVR